MKALILFAMALLTFSAHAGSLSTKKLSIQSKIRHPFVHARITSALESLGQKEATATCAKKLNTSEEEIKLVNTKMIGECGYCVNTHVTGNAGIFTGRKCVKNYSDLEDFAADSDSIRPTCDAHLEFDCELK